MMAARSRTSIEITERIPLSQKVKSALFPADAHRRSHDATTQADKGMVDMDGGASASAPELVVDVCGHVLADGADFLRTQAAWLDRGLVHADRPVVVSLVLEAHARAYESWLELIHSLSAAGCEVAAAEVAGLFAFHGRVAGALEHLHETWLDGELGLEVRRVLLRSLDDRTVDICRSLRGVTPEPVVGV